MTTTTRRLLGSLALVAALTVSGCSGGDDASFEDPGATAPQQSATTDSAQGQQQPSGEQTADIEQTSAQAAGVDLAELGEPVATATIPARVQGDPKATMDVRFYGLERHGKAVVGTFSFTVKTTKQYTGSSTMGTRLYDYLGQARWTPFLVDTTNLTRHDVLEANSTKAMTSDITVHFAPGQTFYAFAAFAAPQDGTKTVTVQMVDGAPPAQGVQVP